MFYIITAPQSIMRGWYLLGKYNKMIKNDGDNKMKTSFRDSASFGKRMEYKIIGDMLMEGLDCYIPLVDDHGVDCIVKKADGTFIEIQIKARSKSTTQRDAAHFPIIEHTAKPNFYFIFYSERLNTMWIMSSEDFLKECVTNKTGKHAGKHSIWLNGNKTNPSTDQKEAYPNPRFNKYIKKDFSVFR